MIPLIAGLRFYRTNLGKGRICCDFGRPPPYDLPVNVLEGETHGNTTTAGASLNTAFKARKRDHFDNNECATRETVEAL